MTRMTLYLSLAVLTAVIVLTSRYYLGPTEETATLGPQSSSGTATIGGPFTLTDHNGKTVTDKDYRGKLLLVYFGYTFCPDVCPTSLSTITDALDMLGEKAKEIQPLFVSVDPGRDTPEHLKEYVTYFHPSMIGLTGTPEQIAAIAKEYRVYYAKVQEEGGEPGEYLMDHSSITYLMGRDGKFLVHFGHGVAPEAMAKRLSEYL